MGRATADSHIAAGEYNVTLLLDRVRINQRIAKIDSDITEKNQEIADLELELIEKIDEVDAEEAAIDSQIDKGEGDGSGNFQNIVFDAATLIAAINVERTNLAIPTVNQNGSLMSAAQQHADYLRGADIITHIGAGNSTIAERIAAAGFGGSTVAENLAGGPISVAEAVQRWMDHPGYKTHILDPAFTDIGVGFAFFQTGIYGYYWVADFGGA